MKFEEIERLVRLVAETGVSEVEVKQSGTQVRVRRDPEPAALPQVQVMPMAPGAAPAPAGAAPAAAAAQPATPEPAAEEEGLTVITASMVGTFYRRPNPEADPFVSEGDVIKKGQVICILEAMKLLNEIEAEIAGTVVKVIADDAQPVEYGEPLFAVRPL